MQSLIPIAELLATNARKDFASQDAKSFLFWWNNNFPTDYWYRKKFNLRFNSPEHRATSFVDMWLEKQEEQEMSAAVLRHRLTLERRKDYHLTGRLLAERPGAPERETQLFDDMDFGALNTLKSDANG